MVIWLIGISGAGKTTLGHLVKDHLELLERKAFLIDGDVVRDFFNNDLGYSKPNRIANIKRILLAAHLLSENGIITIVCNIHPFEDLREFARKKIRDYNEIYLKRDISDSSKKDVKKMYRSNLGKTDIVGIDLNFEKPENCDLVIDTGSETKDESFQRLLIYLKNKYPETF